MNYKSPLLAALQETIQATASPQSVADELGHDICLNPHKALH